MHSWTMRYSFACSQAVKVAKLCRSSGLWYPSPILLSRGCRYIFHVPSIWSISMFAKGLAWVEMGAKGFWKVRADHALLSYEPHSLKQISWDWQRTCVMSGFPMLTPPPLQKTALMFAWQSGFPQPTLGVRKR